MHITVLRRIISVLVLFLLFALPASAQQGSGRTVAWQRFDVDLDLQSNGSLVVTETQSI